MNHHTHYDLIIVGTGLVGASLAVALKNSGFKILCLDKKPLDFHKATSVRPISLSYASVCILKSLALWSGLEHLSAAIKAVHVSTQGGFGRLQFKAEEQGLEALGYVLPYADLERALLKDAFENPHAGFLKIEEIIEINCTEKGAEIQLSAEAGLMLLQTALLVVADGAHSKARELLNIKITQDGAKEIALTANIKLKNPTKSVAFERFSPQGTLAILPSIHRDEVSLVWTMPIAQWEIIQHKNEIELLKIVQSIFGFRVGKMQSLERLAHYPIVNLSADTQIQSSAVLIGNAAHSFYPVAAQGFNLGLRDVAALAEALLGAHKDNQAINDTTVLESYQKERSQDQEAMQCLTKTLHEAFALNLPCFNKARAATLLAIDLVSPLKNTLAKHCIGFAGRVSKLARGIL